MSVVCLIFAKMLVVCLIYVLSSSCLSHSCEKCQLCVSFMLYMLVVCLTYVLSSSCVSHLCDKCQLCVSFIQ